MCKTSLRTFIFWAVPIQKLTMKIEIEEKKYYHLVEQSYGDIRICQFVEKYQIQKIVNSCGCVLSVESFHQTSCFRPKYI